MLECINWDREVVYISTEGMDKLVERWLTSQARRVKPITVTSYREKISYFCRYIDEIEEDRICRDDMEEFGLWLQEQKTKHATYIGYHTRHDALRRLRSFFLWAFREEYFTRNFAFWVPRAEGSAPQRIAPTIGQLNKLLDAARGASWPEREVAIIGLLAGTGIRRIEAMRLNVEDVHFTDEGGGFLVVKGKEDKRRLAVFDSVASSMLVRYLQSCGYPKSGPLFIGRNDGTRLCKMSIYRAVAEAAAKADLSKVFDGCHSLRRLFITYWMRRYKGAGYDDLLRRQVGHESLEMTKQYSLQMVGDIHGVFISPLTQAQMEHHKVPGQYEHVDIYRAI